MEIYATSVSVHLDYLTWGNSGLLYMSYAKNLYIGLEKYHDLYVIY